MVPILKTLMAFVTLFFPISSFLVVKAAPTIMPLQLKSRHDCQNGTSNSTLDFRKQNGLDAQKLNAAFDAMNATDPCQGKVLCLFTGKNLCSLPPVHSWPDRLYQFTIRPMHILQLDSDSLRDRNLMFCPPTRQRTWYNPWMRRSE